MYEYLTAETQRMQNIKTEVLSAIMTPEITSKSLRQYLSNITGKHINKQGKQPCWALRTYFRKC
jgi:hypothetical protein